MIRSRAVLAALICLSGLVAGAPALAVQAAPADPGVLFWAPARREQAFRAPENLSPQTVVRRGEGPISPLPPGDPVAFDPAPYMQAERVAGLLVIQDGRIRLERYGLDLGPQDTWVSFSMTKSLTSTLVGTALKSGAIGSLEDPVTRYLPALAGGGYDGVTIRQLLTMTSGVRWNEDYSDPRSDVARFLSEPAIPGEDPVVTYMGRLPREAEPGARWHYSTGETNLVGSLVAAAEGRPLAALLSERIWSRAGMEADARWALDQGGREMGGCCVSATLRDWGRIGQMALANGDLGGARIVPDDWFAQAGAKQAETGDPRGGGYGFQWWTEPGGVFSAYGIFGQTIRVDPERRLVIVLISAWPDAVGSSHSAARRAFITDITAAIDASVSPSAASATP